MQPALGARSISLLWYRQDLRLTDHAGLHEACACKPAALLPFYVLDDRQFKPRTFPQHASAEEGLHFVSGLPKLGPWRCRFLLQSVHMLQEQLRKRGSDLLVMRGPPEARIPDLVARLISDLAQGDAVPGWASAGQPGTDLPPSWHVTLHYHQEALPEPADVEDRVHAGIQAAVKQLALPGLTWEMRAHWGHTLYHPDDLPYTAMADTVQSGGGRHVESLSSTHQQAGTAHEVSRTSSMAPSAKSGLGTRREGGVDVVAARLAAFPATMTRFRKALRSQGETPVRPPKPPLQALPPYPSLSSIQNSGSDLPSVCAAFDEAGCGPALDHLSSFLGLDYRSLPGMAAKPGSADMDRHDPRSSFQLSAGEEAALGRLRSYLWGDGAGQQGCGGAAGDQREANTPTALSNYAVSRAQASGSDASTHLSAFLGLGCISPRTVWDEVLKVREHLLKEGADTAAADCMLMHLEIRDFYIFTALKEANTGLFAAGGFAAREFTNKAPKWKKDPKLFHRWATGTTGIPFVDACMRELRGSGWMSNRGRQNVASLLAKELNLDWRMGASLFECLLVDHDAAVNYCNWNYFAGTGSDPRDRRFKTISQGITYDSMACLISAWVPETSHLPLPLRHAPFARQELVSEVTQHLIAQGITACPYTQQQLEGDVQEPQQHSPTKKGERSQSDCSAQLQGQLPLLDYPAPVVDPAAQLGSLKGRAIARRKAS
uniref:Photolyase/cryptochrome alpha/beta domain-containing protein n=2 Tax=Dunaliella tertiolecta TaxID=3047 RepID=A0A7S3VN31_DUNTE|mmetsp:Transcript_20275/g.56495  ORF Transcript_20275/g.56495 Transcript_20275/m.56495 type:complete len:716 (+) Transcript_20275:36-2183(+)